MITLTMINSDWNWSDYHENITYPVYIYIYMCVCVCVCVCVSGRAG